MRRSTAPHEVYRGQGDQPLVHVPPIRVTSATFIIEDTTRGDDNADRVIDSGAATIDPLVFSLSEDSGAGTTAPREINVATGGTAFVGHTYALEDGDGQTELVELVGVTSTMATASGDISQQYLSATAGFRGVELSATFPSADAAREDLQEEERPLRVTWTYTLADRTVRVPEQVRVLRNGRADGYLGLAETTLRKDWPEVVRLLPPHSNSVRDLVAACARGIAARLKGRNIAPDTFFAGAQGFEVLLLRCLWRVAERGHGPRGVDPEQWAEDMKINYVTMWKGLVQGEPGIDTAETDRRNDEAPPGSSRRHRTLFALK